MSSWKNFTHSRLLLPHYILWHYEDIPNFTLCWPKLLLIIKYKDIFHTNFTYFHSEFWKVSSFLSLIFVFFKYFHKNVCFFKKSEICNLNDFLCRFPNTVLSSKKRQNFRLSTRLPVPAHKTLVESAGIDP